LILEEDKEGVMKGKVNDSKRSLSVGLTASRSAHKVAATATAINVTFRHVDPTDAIRHYAERKLEHIAVRLKRACSIHLILTVDKYRHQGEVTVKCGRFTVTAQEETKDLYAVIDLLADKVGRQLKSHLAKAATQRVRARSTGAILTAAEDLKTSEDRMTRPGSGRF
jgi:ribosomal subunit interface protein